MVELLSRAWRVFATGLSFFSFGVFGLVLGLIVFPLLAATVRDADRRKRLCRLVISWFFRRFVGFMRGLGLLSHEFTGFERLDRTGLLVLANHPSLIDTVFLLGYVPRSTCVVNEELFRNFFTAGPLHFAGFIPNGASASVMEGCVSALRRGENVLIFPEGTRTPPSGEVRLKRGASNIAIRCGCDVTPVRISCTPRTLMKGQYWWQIPIRPPVFRLEVGEDISVSTFMSDDSAPAIAVRRLNAHLERYLSTEQPIHAVS